MAVSLLGLVDEPGGAALEARAQQLLVPLLVPLLLHQRLARLEVRLPLVLLRVARVLLVLLCLRPRGGALLLALRLALEAALEMSDFAATGFNSKATWLGIYLNQSATLLNFKP